MTTERPRRRAGKVARSHAPSLESAPTRRARRIQTAHANVLDELRSAILTGVCKPGSRLVQTEVAESFSVSITPVREAMRELATEGLLDFDPFRGFVVHVPTREELENVYELRTLLLPLSVRPGVRSITGEELVTARGLAERMTHAADDGEWVHLNREFHRVLDAASGNPQLAAILGRLADVWQLYVGLSIEQQATRHAAAESEHFAILDAYERRAVQRAVRLTLSHVTETLHTARGAFDPAPGDSREV